MEIRLDSRTEIRMVTHSLTVKVTAILTDSQMATHLGFQKQIGLNLDFHSETLMDFHLETR